MQHESSQDEDVSLSELGYDIIGTDGESQAESTTSSFDYTKPYDVYSVAGTDTGTDVDTDSSEDEEDATNETDETTASNTTIVETVYPGEDVVHLEHMDDTRSEEDDDHAEALDMVNRSLESPTNLSFSGFSPFTSVAYLDNAEKHEPEVTAQDEPTAFGHASLVEHDTVRELFVGGNSQNPAGQPLQKRARYETVRRCLWYALLISSSFLLSSIVLVKKPWLSAPVRGILETVPVASLSGGAPLSVVQSTSSISRPAPTTAGPDSSLQTTSSSNSLMFIPFGKGKSPPDVATIHSSQALFSVEVADRHTIAIKIPPSVKASLIANNAILISVSRGLDDISTKVSVYDNGLMVQVPLREAYGIVDVRLATKRKPYANESFRVDLGARRLTEALDAGKQLVRDFAQRVVGTVNETTWWGEDTHMPALDVVSKQVSEQTTLVPGLVVQSVREGMDAVLHFPGRLLFQIRRSVGAGREKLLHRVGQVQVELGRQTRDVGDELRLALLGGQIRSRLLWLKMQGKREEHDRYMSMAEKYWKEQRARVDSARVERTEGTKSKIRSWRRWGRSH
ncbi:hypothetical protein F5Y17DRAFT_444825 [Xylariaceae sp. FL0594]|nr:hypothetical protein F5Y17DRAFT_444825 [Xylariaceae sp. FL0594]